MHLSTDTVDQLGTGVDLLDKCNNSVELGIGRIEVVVVNVKLGTGIGITGSLESDVNERLRNAISPSRYRLVRSAYVATKDVGEDTGTKGTIFIEDFAISMLEKL